MIFIYTTPPASFTLIDPLYNCSTRQLTFRTTGGNGTTIQYMAVGVTGWTTNPVQFIEEAVVADANNKTVQLNARQDGVTVSRIFNFRQACGSSRESVGSEAPSLSVVVLGNPTTSAFIDAEIRGVEGSPVTIQVTDIQGVICSQQDIEHPAAIQPVRMQLGKSTGVYLLRVNTQQQRQTIRVIKAD